MRKKPEPPSCCRNCAYYRPAFYRVSAKEGAAFGDVRGVKEERCGAWAARPEDKPGKPADFGGGNAPYHPC